MNFISTLEQFRWITDDYAIAIYKIAELFKVFDFISYAVSFVVDIFMQIHMFENAIKKIGPLCNL